MKISSLHREFRRYALAERGLRPRTVGDILAVVHRLASFSDTEEVTALSTPAIRAFLQHGKLEKGWSARTFRLYRQYLKTFFDWCLMAGYVAANPVTAIEKPRLPQHLPRCLSQDEARRILYAARHAPWRSELQRSRSEAVVATFLMTGLRRSELLSLRQTDMHFGSGTLAVRGGKGRRDRTVPLHPKLFPLLRHYLAEKARRHRQSEWLFSSMKSEKRLTNKNLYTILRRVSVAAGVKFTPHMLRHTFGRELVEADFNIYKLKEIMGHSSVSTTQAYVALSPRSIKDSFERTRIY
jgi:site-specific recombinase XerD